MEKYCTPTIIYSSISRGVFKAKGKILNRNLGVTLPHKGW